MNKTRAVEVKIQAVLALLSSCADARFGSPSSVIKEHILVAQIR